MFSKPWTSATGRDEQALLSFGQRMESQRAVQDGGDAKVEVSPRDIVYTLTAAAAASRGEPQVIATTDLRSAAPIPAVRKSEQL